MKRKSLNNLNKSIMSVALMLSMSSSVLVGCSSADVKEVANQIQELNDMVNGASANKDFKDPENVVDYLKDKEVTEEEPVEEEVEDPGYVAINVAGGYDSNGKSYAVKVDATGDEIVYSVIGIEDARQEGADIKFETDYYGAIADSVIDSLTIYYDGKDTSTGNIPLNDKELRSAIMQSAEGLLYIEYYKEDDRTEKIVNLLEQINYLIYESADVDSKDLVLDYNLVAVLAKASYDLENFEVADEAIKQAEKLWEQAEVANDDSDLAEINRSWAAAELYRATGAKTYRTIVEAISGDISLKGISFEEPGYFALFAYLSANESTSYDISNRMMKFFLNDINTRIKGTTDDLLNASVKSLEIKNDASELPDEFLNKIADEATLAMMANYITMSVEYTRYAEDRILFLAGANPTGENYLLRQDIMDMDSVVFATCALAK